MSFSRGKYFLGRDFYHIVREACYTLLTRATCAFIVILAFLSIQPATAGNTRISPPPLIGFRINNGNPYTSKPEVTVEIRSLKLSDSLVAEMKIGTDPGLENVSWMKYSAGAHKVTLTGADGEKQVYARLRDVAGNISPVEKAGVVLDTRAPEEITLAINKDEKYTRDEQRRVVVFIQTTENDLAEMMFSNRQDLIDARWEPFEPAKRWTLELEGGDGERSVYAKFRDKAGNESKVFDDQIILDTKPPANGSILINNDEKYTRSTQVKLSISAGDAALVRLVSQGRSEMLPYKTEAGENHMLVPWRLDSAEGVKVVRVYFQDEAGNRTTQVIQDEIILDRTGPPPPVILINNEDKYTNHKDGIVSLRFTSRVNPEMMKMMVSNYPDFHDTNPHNFRNLINNWKLLGEDDGIKTVYASLIDEAGNHSQPGMAKIMLDRKPPLINSITVNEGGKWVTSPKITINLDVEEVSHMQISNTDNIQNITSWESFTPKKIDWPLIPGDGEKTLFLRFKDPADNQTAVTSIQVILDTKPPTGELVIDDGNRFTNNADGKVKLKITSDDAKGMQIANRPDFTNIRLEPFKDSLIYWTLEGEDGLKTVFLRLKDEAGNFSSVISSSIYIDRNAPDELSLVINEGNEWVRNPARRTSVQLNARGASHFMLSENPDFNGSEWETFRNVTSVVLSESEGDKKLYARFRDPAGNVSTVVESVIKLDYTPPVNENFSIDEDSDFTNNPQKQVVLSMKTTGAAKMALSNHPITNPEDIAGKWEDYSETKDWILEGEDGLKTVYAVFQDIAGNLSGISSDRIILDRIAPTDCIVKINNEEKYVLPGGNKIPVEMSAEGADKFIISEQPDFSDARWEMFIPRKVFEVSEGDGVKTIYIKFRDKALNETEVFTGKVVLDSKPPEIFNITVNEGTQYTNDPSKQVTITLEAKDAIEMRISQKGHELGEWEPFAAKKTLTLEGEDGEKEIGIFLRDEAGNVTKPELTTIILDREPPRPGEFVIDDGRGWTNDPDKKVVLNFNADDASEMMISMDPTFEGSIWENFQPSVKNFQLPGTDGEKVIFVKFRDKAGNVSSPISAKVNLKRSF